MRLSVFGMMVTPRSGATVPLTRLPIPLWVRSPNYSHGEQLPPAPNLYFGCKIQTGLSLGLPQSCNVIFTGFTRYPEVIKTCSFPSQTALVICIGNLKNLTIARRSIMPPIPPVPFIEYVKYTMLSAS